MATGTNTVAEPSKADLRGIIQDVPKIKSYQDSLRYRIFFLCRVGTESCVTIGKIP